jgi:hypothetical protein
MTVTVTSHQVKAYMAEHDCGMLEAVRALRIKYIRDRIDGFQWNGDRTQLADALRELVNMVETGS